MFAAPFALTIPALADDPWIFYPFYALGWLCLFLILYLHEGSAITKSIVAGVFVILALLIGYRHYVDESKGSSSLGLTQIMTNSPEGMQAGRDINVSVAPKRGLRLLKTDYETNANGEIITTFTFGSQMLESTPRYSIILKFARPYNTASASFQNLTNFISNGGFDGRPPQTDSSEFIVSGAGIGQSYLILTFTAPYKMELLSAEINPPPEN